MRRLISSKTDYSAAQQLGTRQRGDLHALRRIEATILVERDSQKAIVIGKRGAMLKAIGTDARKALERLLGTHVYLDLRVKVEPRWTKRPARIKALGYV